MGKIIALDKGHGGTDPGAVGHGLREADLVDDIGGRVAVKLSAYDCTVLEVPRHDDLGARARFANDNGADLFLSLHINAGGGTGFESYIHPNAGAGTQAIQATIHSAVMSYLEPLEVVNRGRKTANFQALRETNMPAVLLENLFIDHPWDAAKLADPAFRDGLANEIAYGVVRALNLQKKGCANCQRLLAENVALLAKIQRAKEALA